MHDVLEQSEQGLTLTWRNLYLTKEKKSRGNFWKQKTESIQVLSNVSGAAKSGKLLAIMGPSGAGKTTLLATISCRDNFNSENSLLLNGIPVTPSFMAGYSGFAPQKDLVFEELTVLEHMSFNAALKMSTKIPKEEREKRIRGLFSQFGIANCANTSLRTISGGEMKRVTLCVELLNDPLILFCDEPTTGLDSWAASVVVNILRKIAESGKIVICSIHQPASDTFGLFHEVSLLSEGRTAFHGSTENAVIFFNEINLQCPENYNMAEYFISKISGKSKRICDKYDKSKYALEVENILKSQLKPDIPNTSINYMRSNSEDPLIDNRKKYKPGILMQFRWLIWRLFITENRSEVRRYRFILLLVNALWASLSFTNQSKTPNQESVQNMAGLIFFSITEMVFLHMYGVAHVFPVERSKVLREVANGLFTPAPYYVSKVICLLFTAAVNTIFFATLVYWVSGMQGGVIGYLYYVLILIMSSNVAHAYGLLLSATFSSIDIALLVSVPLQLIGLVFSGIYMTLRSVPSYLIWIKYFSMFRYGTENLLILQWSSVDYIQCTRSDQSCLINGFQVLEKYGFSADEFYVNFLGLCILYMLCHITGYVVVYVRSKKQAVY